MHRRDDPSQEGVKRVTLAALPIGGDPMIDVSFAWACHAAIGPRELASLPGEDFGGTTADGVMDAWDFLKRAGETHGLADDDWDRLALISNECVMIHLHDAGDGVGCGTHLPASRLVRLAVFDEARGRDAILAVCRPGSLVFGCAGLHGLFASGRPWESTAPTTYLFGELAVPDGQPRFANLTFSLLQPSVKT